jgi:hypothetical protein
MGWQIGSAQDFGLGRKLRHDREGQIPELILIEPVVRSAPRPKRESEEQTRGTGPQAAPSARGVGKAFHAGTLVPND